MHINKMTRTVTDAWVQLVFLLTETLINSLTLELEKTNFCLCNSLIKKPIVPENNKLLNRSTS